MLLTCLLSWSVHVWLAACFCTCLPSWSVHVWLAACFLPSWAVHVWLAACFLPSWSVHVWLAACCLHSWFVNVWIAASACVKRVPYIPTLLFYIYNMPSRLCMPSCLSACMSSCFCTWMICWLQLVKHEQISWSVHVWLAACCLHSWFVNVWIAASACVKRVPYIPTLLFYIYNMPSRLCMPSCLSACMSSCFCTWMTCRLLCFPSLLCALHLYFFRKAQKITVPDFGIFKDKWLLRGLFFSVESYVPCRGFSSRPTGFFDIYPPITVPKYMAKRR